MHNEDGNFNNGLVQEMVVIMEYFASELLEFGKRFCSLAPNAEIDRFSLNVEEIELPFPS